jgi:cytochrome c5
MRRLLLVLAAGAVACSSKHDVCEPPTSEVCSSAAPSFSAEIAPILEQRCNNCHAPGVDGGPWPLDTRQNVSDWSSIIIKDLKDCSMPPAGSGVPFSTEERDKLWAWLICGAPDN